MGLGLESGLREGSGRKEPEAGTRGEEEGRKRKGRGGPGLLSQPLTPPSTLLPICSPGRGMEPGNGPSGQLKVSLSWQGQRAPVLEAEMLTPNLGGKGRQGGSQPSCPPPWAAGLGRGWVAGGRLRGGHTHVIPVPLCAPHLLLGYIPHRDRRAGRGGLVAGAVIVTSILLFLAGAFLEGSRFWGLVVQLLSRVDSSHYGLQHARASLFFTMSRNLLRLMSTGR